jgi:large subunit ribosomal protein L30
MMAEKSATTVRFAAIRIRGTVSVKHEINDTMRMLHLERNNCCVVVPKTITTEGMLKKSKDYLAYGEIDDATYKTLVQKRGEPYLGRLTDTKGKIQYGRFIEVDGKKLKPYFRLSPPKGGFERKGIKKSFIQGGALGYRGKEINALIMRMM